MFSDIAHSLRIPAPVPARLRDPPPLHKDAGTGHSSRVRPHPLLFPLKTPRHYPPGPRVLLRRSWSVSPPALVKRKRSSLVQAVLRFSACLFYFSFWNVISRGLHGILFHLFWLGFTGSSSLWLDFFHRLEIFQTSSSQRCPSVLPPCPSSPCRRTTRRGCAPPRARSRTPPPRPQPWPWSRFTLWTVSPSSEPPSAAGFPVPLLTGAPARGGAGWARFSGTTAAGRPPDRQPGQTPRQPRRVGSRGAAGREAAPSLARGVSVPCHHTRAR